MDDDPTRPQHKIYDHNLEDEAEMPAPLAEPTSPFTPRPAQDPSSAHASTSELNTPEPSTSELPAVQDHDRLRLATAAIVQQGLSLVDAADRFGVDADALHVWHRTYVKFAGKHIMTGHTSIPREKIEIDDGMSRRFDENWEEMMRLAELERPQLSPLHQWLLRSPFTRWMFRDEKLDKVTISGAAAVIAFSALAIRAGTQYRGDEPEAGAETSADGIPAVIDLDDPAAFADEQSEALLNQVAQALSTFTQLESWQERLPLIRNAEKVKPLMATYYETHDDGPMQGLVIDPQVSFIKRDNDTFILMQGRQASTDGTAGMGEPIIFLAELVEGEPGLLFDWEVMVNYGPISWSDFVASKSTEAAPFRVRVAADDYYVQPFMDRKQFISFAIRPLHGEETVYAFARRDSELAKQLVTAINKELNGNRAMILKLRYPADAKFDNVLEVESLVADSWMGRK